MVNLRVQGSIGWHNFSYQRQCTKSALLQPLDFTDFAINSWITFFQHLQMKLAVKHLNHILKSGIVVIYLLGIVKN
jgi:hypothetical protein